RTGVAFLGALLHRVPHSSLGTIGDRGDRGVVAGWDSVWNRSRSPGSQAGSGGEPALRVSQKTLQATFLQPVLFCRDAAAMSPKSKAGQVGPAFLIHHLRGLTWF